MMTIKAYVCGSCGTILYSRARHDFRSCSCGKLSVDGGFDYSKVSYDMNLGWPRSVEVKLPFKTEKEMKEALYVDWNKRQDKYGRITKLEAFAQKLYKKGGTSNESVHRQVDGRRNTG